MYNGKMSPLVPPRVNLNGTSREELVEQQQVVLSTLDMLLSDMGSAMPHPRDFQTAPQEYIPAREAWIERIMLLNALKVELTANALCISDPDRHQATRDQRI